MDWIDELLGHSMASQGWCLSLSHMIGACSLTEEKKDDLLRELEGDVTQERAYEIKDLIENNTPCPIQSGRGYTQTDIQHKLNQIEKDGK